MFIEIRPAELEGIWYIAHIHIRDKGLTAFLPVTFPDDDRWQSGELYIRAIHKAYGLYKLLTVEDLIKYARRN